MLEHRDPLGRAGRQWSGYHDVVMRNIISRYIAVLWLLAALSLVGWLLVNLDVAGWILVILTVGLMAWELTTRKGGRDGRPGARGPFGRPDEGPR
jgi:Flp pilus assembly protein TadB